MQKVSIIHKIESDGSQAWLSTQNNAYITFNPSRAGSITDPYVAARVGDGSMMCVDNKDFVWAFAGLVSGNTDAPAYMKTLARRAAKDLKAQGGAK